MSGVAVAALAVAAIGTGYSIYSGEQNKSRQNEAADEARRNAAKQEKASDEATNRSNQRRPDRAAMSMMSQAAKAGGGGTLLTSGVDPNALPLAKTNLLGG